MSISGTHLVVLFGMICLAATPGAALSAESARSIESSVPQIEGLKISIVGEMVVLKGSTSDPNAIAEIEERLRALGHDRIVNGIELERPPSDHAISSAIERELYLSSALAGAEIHVRTSAGIVTLGGSVPDGGLLAAAVQIAKRTKGVREVRSEIEVE